MLLKILLPSQIFAEVRDVTRIVAHSLGGSFGILPHRLDCVAALTPGILAYATGVAGETYVAIDQGVLVKAGEDVTVSIRQAVGGAGLGELHQAVEREFLTLDEREKSVRATLAKLESGLIRNFVEVHHA